MHTKIKLFLLLLFVFSKVVVFSQETVKSQLQKRKESFVKIDTKYLKEIKNISDFSIDHGASRETFGVYLNEKSYQYLIEKKIPYSLQTAPSMVFVAKMANNIKTAKQWDSYPTFETYLRMMKNFADSFPDYCQLDTIGYSVNNRLILSLKISDNVKQTEPEEPQVFFTSSMHGDELVGYVIMLRFANYLLENRNTPEIAEIIQNTELYINPLSNPDGAYQNDNSTVNGATRSNANGVDLNRNFPIVRHNYLTKKTTTKSQIEPENVAMMDYMNKHKFVLSVNFHGGNEVLNYPWDSFQERHNDNKWFQHICRTYVDTVHTIDADYLKEYQNGITNGYDWYPIDGGRQDYVTHFLQGREITAELSHTKLPSGSTLPGYWNKNKKALIQFAKQALYGVAGVISDEENPLQANVKVLNHDKKPSAKSDSTGHFFRFLTSGTYTFEFTAEGYDTLTQSMDIQNFKQKKVAIKLTPTLVQSILLSEHKINLSKGGNKKLIANILPKYAKDTCLAWKSENNEIATVQNGIVTAIRKGETTIFAKAKDGTNLYDSCIVAVLTGIKNYRTENIKIYPNPVANDFTIYFDKNFTFPATISLINTTGTIVKTKKNIRNSKVSISTNLLINGFYIVKIRNKNNTFLKKIFIYKK